MEYYNFDVTIIGAGVVGLAITNELSNYYDDILLVEKEDTFGRHVSSRNSEVIHSGIYYPQDSLKAKLCVEGNRLLYDFVKKYTIDYKKCGKFILAQDLYELAKCLDKKQIIFETERNPKAWIKLINSIANKLGNKSSAIVKSYVLGVALEKGE